MNSQGVLTGKSTKLAAVILLSAAVGIVFYLKNRAQEMPAPETVTVTQGVRDDQQVATDPGVADESRLPRLLELGADKCVPCKMMAPILEELRVEYAAALNVEFIDVWKRPEAAGLYNIQLIPTQIFFDASGKEVFRHQGFFAKADILAKWKELGIDITRKAR